MDSVQLNGFSIEILSDGGPVEKVIHSGSNYFSLPHGSEYKIRVGNDHGIRTDAHVWVDGEKAGVWRINPYSRVTIERPAHVARKFTLLDESSGSARGAGVEMGAEENGLVKIIFKPERRSDVFFDQGVPPRFPKFPDFDDLGYQDGLGYQTIHNPGCSDYTDTVTPYDKTNRKCAMSAQSYSNMINEGISADFGSTLSNSVSFNYTPGATTLGRDSDQRFKRVSPLGEVDHDLVTTIYARLVVDNDHTTYRRPYVSMRRAARGRNTNYPPPIIDMDHPARPHRCSRRDGPFTLSEKYYFDSLPK